MERFQAAARRYAAMVARATRRREKRFDRLGAPEIAFLTETYRSEQLFQDAERRLDPASKARGEWLAGRMEAVGLEMPEHRPTARWAVAVKEATEAALGCYRDFAADGDVAGIFDAWRAPALALTRACGYFVDDTADDFRSLCVRLNETAIEVHEAELLRMGGRVVTTPALPTRLAPKRERKAAQVAERTFAAITMELIGKPRWDFNEPTKERVRGALRFLKEAYWLPLIAMFTGARPEEVAQLLVSDIHQHEWDSRWVIKFTDQGLHPVKGQQSLKTEGQESGRRSFPLPQPLIDLGLLDYLAYLTEQGELALFPLLRTKGKRRGIYASFGEWMCDYVYDQGVFQRGAGRQPVRGFRHTWSTAARSSGIYREAMEYMQGHKAQGGGSANEGYGDRDGLGDQVDRLQFKVNVLDLVPRWQRPDGRQPETSVP